MRKLASFFLSLFIIVLFVENTYSQFSRAAVLEVPPVDETIYAKNHIDDRQYLPYAYLREADVMWSKTIWRIIDLRELRNLQCFYYPQIPSETGIGPRRNLLNTLLYGIKEGKIKAYAPNMYHEFRTEMSYEEILVAMGGGETTITIDSLDDNGNLVGQFPVTIQEEPKVQEVQKILIKELWFFDKQRSQLEVRIIGLCPIINTYREGDQDQQEPTPKRLFWVYYPDAREVLSHQEVFNMSGNDAERPSYDDLFIYRFFNSYIVQESNAYNNRGINEYTIGIESLLEAERINNKIFNFEQDLWHY